jgi:hypothetical protein
MILGSIDVVLWNILPPISHAKGGGKLSLRSKKKDEKSEPEAVYNVCFVISFWVQSSAYQNLNNNADVLLTAY